MSDDATPGIDWRPWGEEAFAAAAERDVPVVCYLTAAWCGDCRRMTEETYGAPRIAAHLDDRFVPVRVDADRRPRVRERYVLGGLPTTAFLTPAGEMLTGVTRVGPDGFRQILDSVAETWAERGADAGSVPRALSDEPTPAGTVSSAIEDHLAGQIETAFDEVNGGWGSEAKFPLPRTIEFALKRDRERALRAVAAVDDHLQDDVAGGFFRYARNADWGSVHYAKTLSGNAGLLRAFAAAYLYSGEEHYREVAAETVEFLESSLWTGAGFGAGQGPAGGAAYFALDAEERAREDDPRRDDVVDAGPNALAADALLALAGYTDDERALALAETTLATIRDRLVDDDGRVRRYDDPEAPTDTLYDVGRVVTAFARSEQVRGEGLSVARRVADRGLDVLRDDDGAFLDGPATGAGLLDRPLRPLDPAAEFAAGLLDLAALTGTERYRAAATDAVAAFAGATARFGPQVADYGSVAARIDRGDRVVVVGDDAGSDLHRAALRIADHEAVVVPRAHERDGGLPAVDPGSARVVVDGDASRPAETPAALLDRVGGG